MRRKRNHPIIRVVAKEVIDGRWGDGDERIKALTQAGFLHNVVQAEVNRQVAEANIEYVRKRVWRNVD